MIICHCARVSDRAIRSAVRAGARTRQQIARNCSAGRACGGCVPAIADILAAESEEEAPGTVPSLVELATG